MDRRFGHGKFQPENASLVDRAFNAQIAVHRFNQPLCERETKTCAFDRAMFGTESFKGNKKTLLFLLDMPGRCLHGNPHMVGAGLAGYGYGPIKAIVLNRVGDEIDQHLFQTLAVATDIGAAASDRSVQPNLALAPERLHKVKGFF